MSSVTLYCDTAILPAIFEAVSRRFTEFFRESVENFRVITGSLQSRQLSALPDKAWVKAMPLGDVRMMGLAELQRRL